MPPSPLTATRATPGAGVTRYTGPGTRSDPAGSRVGHGSQSPHPRRQDHHQVGRAAGTPPGIRTTGTPGTAQAPDTPGWGHRHPVHGQEPRTHRHPSTGSPAGHAPSRGHQEPDRAPRPGAPPPGSPGLPPRRHAMYKVRPSTGVTGQGRGPPCPLQDTREPGHRSTARRSAGHPGRARYPQAVRSTGAPRARKPLAPRQGEGEGSVQHLSGWGQSGGEVRPWLPGARFTRGLFPSA